ncbi:MAG: replicative DNA helicase [Peptostreptococcales bacterium]|jgi:replicative DNA helicase
MAREEMERIPPHSIEAEESVLGSILLDKNAMYEVFNILKPEDFYSQIHKAIFEAIIELFQQNQPIDILTLAEFLKKRKLLDMIGGRAYLGHLSSSVPSTSNVEYYAKIVEEKAVLRRLIEVSSDVMNKSFQEKNETGDVLDYAEQKIFEISEKRQKSGFSIIKEILWDNLKTIDEASRMEGNMTGLDCGFADINNKTSGLQKSDLIMVAARPSMGKTAFCLNIAHNVATKSDAKVAIFSLEMSKEQLVQRILSSEATVEIQKIRTGNLNSDEWNKINMAIDVLSKANIYIDDTPGITPLEIKNKARRLKMDKGLDLIIIDYLQLMSSDGNAESRQQEISTISRLLKHLAREIDCPVITLSQLSRAPELRADHRPILSDLRESGSIEQDADVVMFLYRDEYYNPDTTEKPNVCEVIIAKQRNGPTGAVELAWLGKYTKFTNIYKGSE